MTIKSYKNVFDREGVVVVPLDENPFTENDLGLLNSLSNFSNNKYEEIRSGDTDETTFVYVLRFINDWNKVEYVHPHNQEVLNIISSNAKFVFYKEFDSASIIIRRCQFHVMPREGFIGLHVDHDSNPNWTMVCVLCLDDNYSGGEYIVYHQNHGKKIFKLKKGDLLVAKCDLKHEIRPVLDGERKTLVYFFGSDLKPNVRFSTTN